MGDKGEKSIRKLRSKVYTDVIEILVPVRFYWIDDIFDGIEIGAFKENTTRHQLNLAYKCLDAIVPILEDSEVQELTQIPDVFLRAFREDDKEGEK